MEVLFLETNELKVLHGKIAIELENRAMKRTRLIDVSHNIIFTNGFHRHLPDKIIHIVRDDIKYKWEEIFKVLDRYDINNIRWDGYKNRIELKFNPDNKYHEYHEVMDKKENIIDDIEKLF